MTSDEAIGIAKARCNVNEWPWHEPIFSQIQKSADGRSYWLVTAEDPEDWTSHDRTPMLEFYIDAETGDVLSEICNIR